MIPGPRERFALRCAFWLWAGFVLGLIGCASHPTPPPKITSISLDRDLDYSLGLWEHEARRRFPAGCVVLHVHGTDAIAGNWFFRPDPRDEPLMPAVPTIRLLRTLYPNKPLVIASCNPSATTLPSMPGVYYAKDNVWCEPNSLVPFRWGKGVGSIWEFVEAK
jgi:hypothetical protein